MSAKSNGAIMSANGAAMGAKDATMSGHGRQGRDHEREGRSGHGRQGRGAAVAGPLCLIKKSGKNIGNVCPILLIITFNPGSFKCILHWNFYSNFWLFLGKQIQRAL